MKTLSLIFGVICFITAGYCQIGIGTTQPDQSAMVEVSSKKAGVLIPRMTTAERDAIVLPEHALMIFNTDKGCIELNYGIETNINWNCVGTFSTSSVIPTESEWIALKSAESISNSSSAFASNLKLSSAGRINHVGGLLNQSSHPFYWGSTTNGTNSYYLLNIIPSNYYLRAFGFSVRCIKG